MFACFVQELHRFCVCDFLLMLIVQCEDEDVCHDTIHINVYLWVVCQPVCQLLTMFVVLYQSLYHLFQGNNSRCSKNACLTHPSAEQLTRAMCSTNKLLATYKH